MAMNIAKAMLDNFTPERRRQAPDRDEIYTFVADAVEVLVAQIKEQKARIDELEKSGARFRGVYQRAANYRRGDQVTHSGSLWTALMAVPEGTQPGGSPAYWQLSAKGCAQ